jgi:hypothetical protein
LEVYQGGLTPCIWLMSSKWTLVSINYLLLFVTLRCTLNLMRSCLHC